MSDNVFQYRVEVDDTELKKLGATAQQVEKDISMAQSGVALDTLKARTKGVGQEGETAKLKYMQFSSVINNFANGNILGGMRSLEGSVKGIGAAFLGALGPIALVYSTFKLFEGVGEWIGKQFMKAADTSAEYMSGVFKARWSEIRKQASEAFAEIEKTRGLRDNKTTAEGEVNAGFLSRAATEAKSSRAVIAARSIGTDQEAFAKQQQGETDRAAEGKDHVEASNNAYTTQISLVNALNRDLAEQSAITAKARAAYDAYKDRKDEAALEMGRVWQKESQRLADLKTKLEDATRQQGLLKQVVESTVRQRQIEAELIAAEHAGAVRTATKDADKAERDLKAPSKVARIQQEIDAIMDRGRAAKTPGDETVLTAAVRDYNEAMRELRFLQEDLSEISKRDADEKKYGKQAKPSSVKGDYNDQLNKIKEQETAIAAIRERGRRAQAGGDSPDFQNARKEYNAKLAELKAAQKEITDAQTSVTDARHENARKQMTPAERLRDTQSQEKGVTDKLATEKDPYKRAVLQKQLAGLQGDDIDESAAMKDQRESAQERLRKVMAPQRSRADVQDVMMRQADVRAGRAPTDNLAQQSCDALQEIAALTRIIKENSGGPQ